VKLVIGPVLALLLVLVACRGVSKSQPPEARVASGASTALVPAVDSARSATVPGSPWASLPSEEEWQGRSTYLNIMTGHGACADAGIPGLTAADAGFGDVFGCAKDADCTMTCRGALNATFGRRFECFDGCLMGGATAVCRAGVCVGSALLPFGRGCSPGLFADAGFDCPPAEEVPVQPRCERKAQHVVPVRGFPGHSVAVDDRFVYWTEVNRLERAPIQGGEPEALLGSLFVYSLVVADGDLYFVGRAGQVPGDVSVRNHATGEVRILAPREGMPRITVRGDYVYWESASRGLVRTNRQGGPIEPVESEASSIPVVEGDAHWWVASGGTESTRVLKQRVGTGTPILLGQAPILPFIVACDGAAFWVDAPWTHPKSGRLLRNRAGSPVVEIVAQVNNVDALVCSGKTLFWAEQSYAAGSSQTVIRSIGTDGGSPAELACEDGSSVLGMTVAGDYVYWIAFGSSGQGHSISRTSIR
jgi:hypothetical protein